MGFQGAACYLPIGSLGDLFVHNGAINWYCDHFEHLYLPIANINTNLENAITLFRENPKVTVFGISDINDLNDVNDLIRKKGLFCWNINYALMMTEFNNVIPLWDEQVYTMLDLPFSFRYRYFYLPDIEAESKVVYDSVVENEEYILVFKKFLKADNVVDLKMEESDKQIICLDETLSRNILFYTELIKKASEIHCVPSSVFCFVDSINQETNAKLVYHDIRKNTKMRVNNVWNSYRWEIIEYSQEEKL